MKENSKRWRPVAWPKNLGACDYQVVSEGVLIDFLSGSRSAGTLRWGSGTTGSAETQRMRHDWTFPESSTIDSRSSAGRIGRLVVVRLEFCVQAHRVWVLR